jgi:hypothetical protein
MMAEIEEKNIGRSDDSANFRHLFKEFADE